MKRITGCGGVILREDRVLLIKRYNVSTFNDLWSNPGGKVEPGETVEDAVKREMYEEIGVRVEIKSHLGDYDDGKKGSYAGYLVEIIEGTARIMEPDKISDLDWFRLNELPEALAPYTQMYLNNFI